MGDMQLTQEQLDRIARNREEAMKKYEARRQRIAEGEKSAMASTTGPNQSANNNFANANVNVPDRSLSSNTSAAVVNRSMNAPPTANPYNTQRQFSRTTQSTAQMLPLDNHRPRIYVGFSVANTKRIKVMVKPYCEKVIDLVKTLLNRVYDPKDKCWSIGFPEYNKLVGKLKEAKDLNIDLQEIDVNLTRIFNDDFAGRSVPRKCPDDLSTIDATLVDSLFPFQREGVCFGIEKDGRLLLADEMGLGKSIQALGIARHYYQEWPLLICCPSSVKYTWKTQINKFLPAIKDYDINIIDKGSDPLPRARSTSLVIIMSFELMGNRIKELLEHSFYVLIFDESHFLKDGKTKRTKAAIELGKKASRVILLSGTPALSRPSELFSQIRIIDHKIFPNFNKFGERYCDGKNGRFGYETKGATNTSELVAILEKTIMIRRLKKNVLDDLPEKRREIIYLSGDAIDQKMNSLKLARDACMKEPADNRESLMRYYTETAIVKAQSVGEHIVESYFYDGAQRIKMLIFAHHTVVLDAISMMLTRKSVKFIRIDGSVSASSRSDLCERFQTDSDTVVALLSITAAGTGITLTAASHIIFAELHWNPGTMMQAEDRAHRVGQKNPVTIQYMLARKTADDDIWPLVAKKLKMLGEVKLSSDDYKGADFIYRDCCNRDISAHFEKLNGQENINEPLDGPFQKRPKRN